MFKFVQPVKICYLFSNSCLMLLHDMEQFAVLHYHLF